MSPCSRASVDGALGRNELELVSHGIYRVPGADSARTLARALHVHKIRAVAALADGKAANPFESVLRAIAGDVPGLTVRPQVPIFGPDFLGRPDLVDEDLRIILEADTRCWSARLHCVRLPDVPRGYRLSMANDPQDYDVTATDQDVEGDIGVSSGRPGDTGEGQHAPTGSRDTSERDSPDSTDEIEGRPHEQNSQSGLPPKSGYSSYDPRSDEATYEPGRHDGV